MRARLSFFLARDPLILRSAKHTPRLLALAQDKVNEGKDLNAHAEEAFKRVKEAYSAIRDL